MQVVLDASVILKWFRDEPDSQRALDYRNKHLNGAIEIVCPVLLHYEILNALTTKIDLSMQDVLAILSDLNNLEIAYSYPNKQQTRYAAMIAIEKRISFYDASYIALAYSLGTNFVTADQKLVSKIDLSFVALL